MKPQLLAIALLAVALTPTVAAHEPDPEIVYKFTYPGEATGWVNHTFSKNDSQDFFALFDGNSDQYMNETEVDELESFIKDAGDSDDDSPNTAWHGKEPSTQSTSSVTAVDAQGPYTNETRLHTHAVAKIAYPTTPDQDSYEWRRLTEDIDDGRHFKARAPPGYEVTDHRGLDDVTVDGAWITGTSSSEENIGLTFSKIQEQEPATEENTTSEETSTSESNETTRPENSSSSEETNTSTQDTSSSTAGDDTSTTPKSVNDDTDANEEPLGAGTDDNPVPFPLTLAALSVLAAAPLARR